MADLSLSEYANRPKPTKKQTMPPSMGIMAAGIIVVIIISFIGGMQYQKGKTPTAAVSQAANSKQSSGFGGSGFQRGDRAIGTVSAVSSSSITIQTRGGTTSTYTLTSSTTVTDSGQSSTVSNIQTGDTVLLTLSSSNTKDVDSIMVNPSFGGFGGGFSAPDSGSNTNSGSSTGSNTGSSTSASSA